MLLDSGSCAAYHTTRQTDTGGQVEVDVSGRMFRSPSSCSPFNSPTAGQISGERDVISDQSGVSSLGERKKDDCTAAAVV